MKRPVTSEQRLDSTVDERRLHAEGQGQSGGLTVPTARGEATGRTGDVPDEAEVTQFARCVEDPVNERTAPEWFPDLVDGVV